MTNPEQTLDAALREAYEKGFSDGREAAARVCDGDAAYLEGVGFKSRANIARRVAARIRALKSQEPQ